MIAAPASPDSRSVAGRCSDACEAARPGADRPGRFLAHQEVERGCRGGGRAARSAVERTFRIFEREAAGYEAWYATQRGRRVDEAERGLIGWLLAELPVSHVVLDDGCGTGHFAAALSAGGRNVFGLDRSPAMLAEARHLLASAPLVLGDAQRLPVRERAVDVTLLVATLEFLDDPDAALAEAVRAARHGVAVVAFNRWSRGGLSRRLGKERASPILGVARDYSRRSLRRALVRAAGTRLRGIRWASTLFPAGLWRARRRVAVGGDVLGMVALLADAAQGC
jgi:ubiquinone/menaquinone biosynthesis C-methylase UbiE